MTTPYINGINNIFYWTCFTIVTGYVVCIITYAYEHFRIEYNESVWETATDEEVVIHLWLIIKEYDASIKQICEKDKILKKAQELNNNNMDFKIRCYKEGIKDRMKTLISQ